MKALLTVVFDRLKAWITAPPKTIAVASLRRWHLVVLTLVLTFGGSWLLNHHRGADAEAARSLEAARLKADGLIVAQQSTQEQLAQAVDKLTAEHARNDELKTELERVKKAAPGSRVVQVISASTAPAVVTAQPEKDSACVVKPGDKLDVQVSAIELKTKEKNLVLAGVARCLRVDGNTSETLVSAPFEASTTSLKVLDEQKKSFGWGLGPLMMLSTHGTAYGIQLSPPPLDLLGFRLEAVVGATLGTAGGSVTGGVIVRR